MNLEIQYYSNGRGGTAISVDGGENVIVKNGRALLQVDTTWEEDDEDECGPLSPEQEAAIEARKAEIKAQSQEEAGLSEIVQAYRKRRLREAVAHPTARPKLPVRKIRSTALANSGCGGCGRALHDCRC